MRTRQALMRNVLSNARALVVNRDGNAFVELGIAMPIILVCVSAVANLTIHISTSASLQSASDAGARKAAQLGFDQSAITSAVQNATGLSGVQASPSPRKTCGCPTSSQAIQIAQCSTQCSDGSTPTSYALVSATVSYADPVPIFGTGGTSTITSTSWARLN